MYLIEKQWNACRSKGVKFCLSPMATRSFLWGQDVSGALATGAGVGALLMEVVHENSEYKGFLPAHDVNGNVVGMLRQSDGYVSAIYEYGPYGEFVRTQVKDSALDSQPVRFSSRYTDRETGLVYYGYRYYSPSLGRFLSRDPQGESGGINLYAFCKNDPINRWDMLGLETLPSDYRKDWFRDDTYPLDPASKDDSDGNEEQAIRDLATGKNGLVVDVSRTSEEFKEKIINDMRSYFAPKQFSGVDATSIAKQTEKSTVSPLISSVAPNSLADSGTANRQFQPLSKADAATKTLLGQMNSNMGFLGQVETIMDKSQVTVKTQTEMRNGQVVQVPYRQEWGFTGYSTGSDGIVRYDLGLLSSKPYDGFSVGAQIKYSMVAPPDATTFVVHAHSFTNGSSDGDWVSRGTYTITIIPASQRVEIILPNGSGGYQGTVKQVFPGLGGP